LLGVLIPLGARSLASEDNVSLACGVPVTRQLAADESDSFELSLDAGTTALVEATDTSGTIGLLRLQASGPSGDKETCSGTVTVNGPGTTELEVSDCIGADSGSYTITATVVSSGAGNCGMALDCGGTPDGVGFSAPGEIDSYAFSGFQGGRVTLTATDETGAIGAIRLRLFGPDGAPVSGADSCSGSINVTLQKSGTFTAVASACGGLQIGRYRITRQGPDCPVGPVITYFGIVNVDGAPLFPVGFDTVGRPIYERQAGRAFSVVVEGQPGSDGRAVGSYAFNSDPADPSVLPDLQVLLSRPLGDGSTTVCDKASPDIGGVPATPMLEFAPTQAVADAINDFGCRVDNGTGGSRARLSPLDACTTSNTGFGFAFVDPKTTAQFCAPIALDWAFPVGDTVVVARLRDTSGALGMQREIVVRVTGSGERTETYTPSATPTPTLTPTAVPTRTTTATRTPSPSRTPSRTSTPTRTPSSAPTASFTRTATRTPTPTRTTPSPTATATSTPTLTAAQNTQPPSSETPTVPTTASTATPTPTGTGPTTFTETATVSPTASLTETPMPIVCVGDCGNNNQVTVEDLAQGVSITLGQVGLGVCPQIDVNRDGTVTVDELVEAVGNALNGCSEHRSASSPAQLQP
jgi:hypothetical protein